MSKVNSQYHINLIFGENVYRNEFVHQIIYEYLITNKYKFGTVIGNIYPYYMYFSDNLYIRYVEDILCEYLRNMDKMYETCKEHDTEIEDNLLIVDYNKIDFKIPFWNYFIKNHKTYKTTIIFVTKNINVLDIIKYIDNIYLLFNKFNTVDKLSEMYRYKLLFENISEISFHKVYNFYSNKPQQVLYKQKEKDNFYIKTINLTTPDYMFNTYNIYDEDDMYRRRVVLRDIIKINS